jgi:hypothetical protein
MNHAVMRRLGAFVSYVFVSHIAAWYHAPLIMGVSLCLAAYSFVSMWMDDTPLF